jgi:Domain of unknown function (DUF3846)
MGAALIIQPDGEITDVHLKPGENHLALMYEHLNCTTVDVVRLTTVLDMWIDDEGLYTQPPNPAATALARHYGHLHQPYHGPVMICTANQHGNSTDLDTTQLRVLLTHLHDLTVVPG